MSLLLTLIMECHMLVKDNLWAPLAIQLEMIYWENLLLNDSSLRIQMT